MKYNTDQLRHFPWIVSSATLRTEDLLPSFWSAAETLAVMTETPIPADLLADLALLVGEDSSETDWSDELASQTLESLSDYLQDRAPSGFYFGSHEGDGACFGFWLQPEWSDLLEHCGFAADSDPEPLIPLIADLCASGIDPDTYEDAYCGETEGYNEDEAGAAYAEQLAEELSPSFELDRTGSIPWPFRHIDWSSAWQELEIGDGYWLQQINGCQWAVFRNV